MGDRAQCHILIGGKLDKSLFQPLCQHIADYDLRTEWDGDDFDPATLREDEPLDLYGDQLNGGSVPDLESFCTQHGLQFRRWSGSCLGAFGPELVAHYGPGDRHHAAASDDEEPVFTPSDIAAVTSLDELNAVVAEFSRPLPPFAIAP